jgi:KDO2-lipid IV(A) lauroyltransferase
MAKHTVVREMRHLAEAAAVFAGLALFRILPVDAASALGGFIGRAIGPRLPISRHAVENLRAAFPDMAPEEIARIVRGVWDNVGRTFAEYPHLDTITKNAGNPGARVVLAGIETLNALRTGGPALMFAAHLSNWELLPVLMPAVGLTGSVIYRDPNNPYVSRLLRRARRVPPERLIPKGAEGARRALTVLQRGERLGMLIDQKMNDGIAVPFFGRDAMTAPALARFALRFRCPVVPVRIQRLVGARFRVILYAPLAVQDTGDRETDVASTMTRVNKVIEDWIRERPEEWLWIHRRWPDQNTSPR